MLIRDLIENWDQDDEHYDALEQTGYWGRQGAGCIFFAQDTKRFGIFHRSGAVLEPYTWGGVGGAIDQGEDPKRAVTREAYEEAGYRGPLDLRPLYIFRDKSFQYTNFVGVVPKEFRPVFNWENVDAKWVTLGEWPTPLHPGLVKAFADPAARDILTKIAS